MGEQEREMQDTLERLKKEVNDLKRSVEDSESG